MKKKNLKMGSRPQALGFVRPYTDHSVKVPINRDKFKDRNE